MIDKNKAARDAQNVAVIMGATPVKVFFHVFWSLVFLGVIYYAFCTIAGFLEITLDNTLREILGSISMVVWGYLMYLLMPYTQLDVDPNMGKLARNTITGTRYWYDKPRTYFKYVWEVLAWPIEVMKELKVSSGENPLDPIKPEPMATKDGGVFVQYMIVLRANVTTVQEAMEYHQFDDAGRAEIFKDTASAFISDDFILRNSNDTLAGKQALSVKLLAHLQGATPKEDNEQIAPADKKMTLQELYNVSVISAIVSEVTLQKDLQDAKDQIAIAKSRNEAICAYFGLPAGSKVTPAQMEIALASEKAIDYEVRKFDITGLQGLKSVSLLPSMLPGQNQGQQGGGKKGGGKGNNKKGNS